MNNLSVSFHFGGAFGQENLSIGDFKKENETRCSEAASWLKETPSNVEGHGWIDLPDIDTAEIKETAKWLKGYDSIIHVGIGGSALGNLMLNQSLLSEYHNSGACFPKFYLADNPDPTKTHVIWEQVKEGTVALVGVSKSGATAETMSQFLWFREKMTKLKGNADEDILVITDPEKGIFRAYAKYSGCKILDLPPSVGGRYSVLSAAGLVSAYALGIDIDAILEGAGKMKKILLENSSIDTNPAWIASSLHLFHEQKGRPMAVIMPYSSKMAFFAEWFAQLWGESLGKEGKGTTPVRALGAIDQHSQVQLYTDGPDDKFFTLINLKKHGERVYVPPVDCDPLKPLSYLDNAELGNMLRLEAMSTAAALVKKGRPLIWMEIDQLDCPTLGALIFYYEYMTAMTGRMMGIDPFNQPGVEQGKKYTYGLMGRKGFEEDATEAKEWFQKISGISLKI
ncbi:MAG: glucose-6-phosphate isomerase [Synergistaceae bacterium]|nr:glucose-6-phosphate isomerase [Synergistaceae bacterium]